MPSDENSQITVLEESKAETGQQLQNVTDSGLNQASKSQLTDSLLSKTDNINSDIKQKEVQKQQKDARLETQRQKQSVSAEEIEKQTADTGAAAKALLDRRA
jgi:preprotein translocase subunit SecD